ncbi:hypothetical protein [Microvirga arsenatis]|uniref:Rap1a immunity protein domain-containing protein n=1 Tax=Microvirga arsenatis TaxID=2692265 RepID=A0ABW9Z095_9HYPH|nr:hypothetical protein [Microvirga arsenatis]NBJ13227.1 hypothetical protein [Microvirga arsenatis]NBJ25135.1 hypothetical protein [Microvirga arsenatis]
MKITALCLSTATIHLLSSVPGAAQTFTQSQRNAMNHVSQVLAAATACPEYKPNLVLLALIGVQYKFSIEDPKVNAIIVAKAKEHKAGIEAAGKTIGCLAAWALYGPGGQNVPDLLSRN